MVCLKEEETQIFLEVPISATRQCLKEKEKDKALKHTTYYVDVCEDDMTIMVKAYEYKTLLFEGTARDGMKFIREKY